MKNPISKHRPPAFGKWLLVRSIGEARALDMDADLHDLYQKRLEQRGRAIANLLYLRDVASIWVRRRQFRQDRFPYAQARSLMMWKSYLRVAGRTIHRHKSYAAINVAGLTVGLACALFMFLYVDYEQSYDTFHHDADRIGRIITTRPTQATHSPITPTPFASTLAQDVLEVEHATAIRPFPETLLGTNNQHFLEDGIFAEAPFLNVFSFAMRRGDSQTALERPDAIVLTASLAQKHFGAQNPIGQIMTLNEEQPVTVTGVIEDVPANAHFTFDFILPAAMHPRYAHRLTNWRVSEWYTYFKVAERHRLEQVDAKLPAFTEQYIGASYQSRPETTPIYSVQPLTAIHLHSLFAKDIAPQGNILYVYIFGTIGILVLLIACINYVNLATARSVQRVREVGVRKALGAQQQQLMAQFFSEAIVLTFASMVLAVLVVLVLLPTFRSFVDREIVLGHLTQTRFLLTGLGLGMLVALLSGGYPALVVTRWKPIHALRGALMGGRISMRLRNGLVVGQFAVAMVLGVGSFGIAQQLAYIHEKEMGYNREHVVVARVHDETLATRFPVLKQHLLTHPAIEAVASSKDAPTLIRSSDRVRDWEGKQEGEDLSMHFTRAGYDFIELFDMEVVEGRPFSEAFATDEDHAYVLNEAAAKQLGWQSAVGKRFRLSGYDGAVVGVVKDFHFRSLHEPIAPIALLLDPNRVNYISLRVDGNNLKEALAFAEATFQQAMPAYPFDYQFLDDVFGQQYTTDRKLGQLFNLFMGLALFITALGMAGLVAFTTAQRTKEVGVRKVLGASIAQIIYVLTQDLLKRVGVAFGIAVPIAYLILVYWLDQFAYRIDVGVAPFLWAGGLAILTIGLTISLRIFKVARTNPTEALRYE